MKLNALKKTLTGVMVALMACTSMSVVAKGQWVFSDNQEVWGNYNGTEIIGFDALCRKSAAERALIGHPWKVEYHGGWQIVGGDTAYCNGINELDIHGKIVTSFFCRKGRYFFEHPSGSDGCYEYLDCDPALYPDGKLPEGCPKPEPLVCPLKPPFSEESDRHEPGTTICNSADETQVCVYPEMVKTGDGDADKLLVHCIKLHEGVHRYQHSNPNYDTECVMGNPAAYSAKRVQFKNHNIFAAEKEAYKHTLVCLEDNIDQCKGSKSCIDIIETVKDSIKKDYFQ